MLKINMKNVKKYYGERLVLDIDELSIHKRDKVGIVGLSGVGKTTLLKLLLG